MKGGHQRKEMPLHCAVIQGGDAAFVKTLLEAEDYQDAMNAQVRE